MLKFISKLKQKVATIQRNAKIARNVMLLINDDRVRNNYILRTALTFIVTDKDEHLNSLASQLNQPTPMYTHILAEDQNGFIGVNDENGKGSLPWSCKEDMQHFVKHTLNKICIVGGTTFRSFGARILYDRTMIVVTRDKATIDRITVLPNHYHANNVEDAIHIANSLLHTFKALDREVMIIGGAQVYKQTLPYVTKVLLSRVNVPYENVKPNIERDWVYPSTITTKVFDFVGAEKQNDK